jgi:hypothetical protein
MTELQQQHEPSDSTSASTSTLFHPAPSVDVFFGVLKRNPNSKRIRKRTSSVSIVSKTPQQQQENGEHEEQGGKLMSLFSFSKASTSSTTVVPKTQQQLINDDTDLEKFSESAFYQSVHIQKLKEAIQEETTNTVADDSPLRKELWHGVVEQPLLRAETWRLSLGITPATNSRRLRDAQRQILEYRDYLKLYYYCSNDNNNNTSSPSDGITSPTNNIMKSKCCIFPSIDTLTPNLDKRTKTEKDILNQLAIDLPRHKAAIYFLPELTERLRRCLFVWALRNPAVGYVQGMDDVVNLFFGAFLDEAFALIEPWNAKINSNNNSENNSKNGNKARASSPIISQQNNNGDPLSATTTTNSVLYPTPQSDSDLIKSWLALRQELKGTSVPNYKFAKGTRPWTDDVNKLREMIALLPACALDVVECDTYNCGGRFLSWGMDRYTFGQPGVLACVETISSALKFFDPELHTHIRDVCGLEFKTFAYKYVHLLLVRDLGQWLSMRLFDTLLSAGASQCWELFSYFCVAWLLSIRNKILHEIPIDEALFFMQEPARLGSFGGVNGSKEGKSALRWIEELLSKAYLLMLQKKSSSSSPKGNGASSPLMTTTNGVTR